jgi:hypothetical protein
MADPADRDARTIFIVRALLLAVVLGLLPCFLIAGAAKLIAPDYDAGELAWTIGWPFGFTATIIVVDLRRRRGHHRRARRLSSPA